MPLCELQRQGLLQGACLVASGSCDISHAIHAFVDQNWHVSHSSLQTKLGMRLAETYLMSGWAAYH